MGNSPLAEIQHGHSSDVDEFVTLAMTFIGISENRLVRFLKIRNYDRLRRTFPATIAISISTMTYLFGNWT